MGSGWSQHALWIRRSVAKLRHAWSAIMYMHLVPLSTVSTDQFNVFVRSLQCDQCQDTACREHTSNSSCMDALAGRTHINSEAVVATLYSYIHTHLTLYLHDTVLLSMYVSG